MVSKTGLTRLRGPIVVGLAGLALLVGGVLMITAKHESPISEALQSSGSLLSPTVVEPASVPDADDPIADPTAVETPPTTSEPEATTTAAPSTTTTVGPGGGFATAIDAVYASLGYEDSPTVHCNSGDAGPIDPCWDQFTAQTYLLRPSLKQWYWVLITEYGDGTFDFVDVVPVEDEYDFPNSPWDD